MNNKRWANAARWLGVISSLAAIGLWIRFAYMNEFYRNAVTTETWAEIIKMIMLSAIGTLTALAKKPPLMLVVFSLSFVPAGLYLLGAPGWARLIGIADLLFAVSSLMMLSTRYRIMKI